MVATVMICLISHLPFRLGFIFGEIARNQCYRRPGIDRMAPESTAIFALFCAVPQDRKLFLESRPRFA
jgi:hypothetical protein